MWGGAGLTKARFAEVGLAEVGLAGGQKFFHENFLEK